LKRKLISTSAIRISLGAAVCALLAIPVACSDDTNDGTGDNTEAGTGGGDDGTGGKGTAGKGGSGGSAGKATGGSAGSTGGTGMGGGGGKAGSAGTGGMAAGGTDGGTGPETGTPGTPEAGTGDGGDGGPPNPCPDPAETPDANAPNSKVCLRFAPEQIAVSTTDTQLDGKGVLLIQFYDTDTLTATTVPLKTIQYPPPPATPLTGNESVYSLPQIDVEGLPETVYMRVLFVDNQAFFVPAIKTLTWGMFIGNLDLSAGVLPPPKLKKLTLTNDKGTMPDPIKLTALRKISTSIELMTGVTPADDGQGPLSVGCFDVAAPSNAPVRGGAQLGCKNVTAGPITGVTAFTYGSGDRWVGAQLDDFNQGGTAKIGNIASLGGGTGQSILDSQKITFAADQYSATLAKIVLNYVLPGATPGTAPFIHFACP